MKSFPICTPVLMAAAAIVLAGCGSKKEETTTPPPTVTTSGYNVVLVVSDALRADALGCYGGEARTPNIDRLAARGVRFENAYATSPWTPPSAVSIFTGNYATSYPYAEYRKTIKIQVPDEELLLAEVLKNRGYVTAIKNENVQASLHNCFQGLDPLKDEAFYDNLTPETRREIRGITGGVFRGNLQYLHNYHLLLFLQSVPDDKNFFAVQWILDPHEPYSPVKDFLKKIRVDRASLTGPPAMYVARKNIKGTPNEAETRYLKARYQAEVESVDERIGYIQSVLERENRADSTFFIFTADHGEMFGEHGRFGHGRDYYEEIMRVPLIVAGPGLPRGKRVESAVSLVDLMPTIADLLGFEYAIGVQGKSLRSYMRDEPAAARPVYFDDVRQHGRVDGLIDGGYKLVILKDGASELYFLPEDPVETRNIAARDRDRAAEMFARIVALRADNRRKQEENLLLVDEAGKDEMTEQEKRELQRKLKSLGYIQ
jgi:arylsulfatase A-like enzyme